MKRILGVDLGASYIKLCQIIEDGENIIIDKIHKEKIDTGYWKDKNKIADLLKKIIALQKFKPNYVSVNIPKYAAIIKSTSFFIFIMTLKII